MKLRASLKRKTVHVFRQKVKATKFENIVMGVREGKN